MLVRVRLKGINWVRRALADGTVKDYPYLGRGRGAIRLEGGRDSPEEVALLIVSYDRVKTERRKGDLEIFKSIITAFMLSPAFKKLRPRTRASYQRIIRLIEDKFGDLPISALNDQHVTKDFLDWRDSMADTPCQADYARQADLVALPWSAYDDTPKPDAPLGWITWTPSKTISSQGPQGPHTSNAPPPRLARPTMGSPQVIALSPDDAQPILANSDGHSWKNAGTLSTRFGKARDRVPSLKELHFHDLRGTAVTRLSEAGCTPQEISAITGHSIDSVEKIIERYCARTDKLASNAILKLEKHRG